MSILADARRLQPALQALLMDEATLAAHQHRITREDKPCEKPKHGLDKAERDLFQQIYDSHTRLEQERLAMDYVQAVLERWIRQGKKPAPS